jgi:hypothetical protein
MVEQRGVRAWVISIWFSVNANGGLIWTKIRTVWFHECREFIHFCAAVRWWTKNYQWRSRSEFYVTRSCVGLGRETAVCLHECRVLGQTESPGCVRGPRRRNARCINSRYKPDATVCWLCFPNVIPAWIFNLMRTGLLWAWEGLTFRRLNLICFI